MPVSSCCRNCQMLIVPYFPAYRLTWSACPTWVTWVTQAAGCLPNGFPSTFPWTSGVFQGAKRLFTLSVEFTRKFLKKADSSVRHLLLFLSLSWLWWFACQKPFCNHENTECIRGKSFKNIDLYDHKDIIPAPAAYFQTLCHMKESESLSCLGHCNLRTIIKYIFWSVTRVVRHLVCEMVNTITTMIRQTQSSMGSTHTARKPACRRSEGKLLEMSNDERWNEKSWW